LEQGGGVRGKKNYLKQIKSEQRHKKEDIRHIKTRLRGSLKNGKAKYTLTEPVY